MAEFLADKTYDQRHDYFRGRILLHWLSCFDSVILKRFGCYLRPKRVEIVASPAQLYENSLQFQTWLSSKQWMIFSHNFVSVLGQKYPLYLLKNGMWSLFESSDNWDKVDAAEVTFG